MHEAADGKFFLGQIFLGLYFEQARFGSCQGFTQGNLGLATDFRLSSGGPNKMMDE